MKVSLSLPSLRALFSISYKACIYSSSNLIPSDKIYFIFVGFSELSKPNIGLKLPKGSEYTMYSLFDIKSDFSKVYSVESVLVRLNNVAEVSVPIM